MVGCCTNSSYAPILHAPHQSQMAVVDQLKSVRFYTRFSMSSRSSAAVGLYPLFSDLYGGLVEDELRLSRRVSGYFSPTWSSSWLLQWPPLQPCTRQVGSSSFRTGPRSRPKDRIPYSHRRSSRCLHLRDRIRGRSTPSRQGWEPDL